MCGHEDYFFLFYSIKNLGPPETLFCVFVHKCREAYNKVCVWVWVWVIAGNERRRQEKRQRIHPREMANEWEKTEERKVFGHKFYFGLQEYLFHVVFNEFSEQRCFEWCLRCIVCAFAVSRNVYIVKSEEKGSHSFDCLAIENWVASIFSTRQHENKANEKVEYGKWDLGMKNHFLSYIDRFQRLFVIAIDVPLPPPPPFTAMYLRLGVTTRLWHIMMAIIIACFAILSMISFQAIIFPKKKINIRKQTDHFYYIQLCIRNVRTRIYRT